MPSQSPSQSAIFLSELWVVLPLIVLPLKTPTILAKLQICAPVLRTKGGKQRETKKKKELFFQPHPRQPPQEVPKPTDVCCWVEPVWDSDWFQDLLLLLLCGTSFWNHPLSGTISSKK